MGFAAATRLFHFCRARAAEDLRDVTVGSYIFMARVERNKIITAIVGNIVAPVGANEIEIGIWFVSDFFEKVFCSFVLE